MTNCNYSEYAKNQRKEIQKQIEELQQKLEELEQQKSPVEIAFKDNYGVYPDELKSNDDFNCWVSFKRGYIAAKQDKIVKQPEEIDWKSVALCFGEELVDVGPDGYYDFTPAQWLEWTKKVYKQVEEPRQQTLYNVIADWWDEIFMNGNPSGQNIESLVEQIVKLVPDSVVPNRSWDYGYNAYRRDLLLEFNGK